MKPQNDILDNYALWKENVKLKGQLADKRHSRSSYTISLESEILRLQSEILRLHGLIKYREKVIKKLRASRAPSP